MVKVERLPSGSYRARVHLGGGKYKPFTGKDKKDVQLRAAQFEANMSAQGAEQKPPMTLGEAMDKYISIKDAVLSPATIRGYVNLRTNRAPSLAEMEIDDITQEDVQRAINEDALDHSPKSVRNLHGFISAVLGVYRPDLRLHTTLPQRKKPEIKIPTEEEVSILFEYFNGTEMELPMYLAACCGLRESEICALRWEHVDLKKGRIRIVAAKVLDRENKLVEKGTKSEAGDRSIRLYAFVKDALERAEQKGKYLTTLKPNTIYARFVAALKVLGIQHYRFHDLRHYLVSAMLSLNIPKKYIADYVGHADEAMIDRVYAHIMASKKTSVEDMMDEYFSKSVTKSVTIKDKTA